MTLAHPSPPGQDAPQYPWAEWLDGKVWHLVRGRDFWDRPDVFRRRIQGAANGRGIKVRIGVSDDQRFIRVEAVPRTEPGGSGVPCR